MSANDRGAQYRASLHVHVSPDVTIIIYRVGRTAIRSSLALLRGHSASRPELNVLVLGPLEPNVEILIALASGACGYLPSNGTPSTVAAAVDAMLARDAVLPRAVTSPLIRHVRRGAEASP